PHQFNVVEELLDKAATRGWAERPLLRSSRIVLSYADVRDRVDRICRVLVEDLGLVPGNRVLLRGGNSIGLALAWLAVVKAGGIAVATMPLLRAGELGHIIDQARPILRQVVSFNAPTEPGSLAVRAAQKDGGFEPCPTAADDIALLAFTSGT